MVCLCVILCYRITCLWLYNKRFLCNKKGVLFVPDPVFSYNHLYFFAVIFPLSFLILFIWVLSLFLLMSLSILFIFLKNQLLDSLIFCIISLDSILFISALIFIMSFLLLTLSFVYSLTLFSPFKCVVRLFI